MKHIYFCLLLAFSFGNILANNNSFAPTATVSGPGAVCLNEANTFVVFTGSGGTAPYTFTYTINGGAVLTVSTTGSNDDVTVPINTTAVTSFKYDLKSVKDKTSGFINQTGTTTVTVNAPPTIDFTFSNNNTCSGTSIQFTSTVTGNYTYSWDFGDGTPTSNQKNPTHAFTALGCGTSTFKVVLTVNGDGCSVSKSHDIIVKQKPDINFTDVDNPYDPLNPFNNCANASTNPVYKITVGNSSTSTCITSYSINWGDGNTENNISFPISHTYNFTGAYSMVITANGTNGCVNTKTYIIKNISNPKGGLNSPGSTQDLCAPTTNLQFSISNWGTNSLDTTYNIDYGDGSPILVLTQNELLASTYYNASSPENSLNYPIPHIYTTSSCPAPSFEVNMAVTNACSTTPFALGNISILSKPTTDFTSPPKACVNTSVLFTNTTVAGYGKNCVQGAIYTWDFGDGSPIITTPFQSPQSINHTYVLPGTYTVILTSQNLCGPSSKTKQICIEPAITPAFTVNSNSGCSPFNVTTTNNTSLINQCSAPDYEWSVVYTADVCGISIPPIPIQTTKDASYNFTEPGTYVITLKASNSCTPAKTISETVVIKKPPTVTAINGILPNYCGTANISPTATFNSCTSATATLTYAWSFPGGTPSSANTLNPGTINYTATGNHTVSLIVSNDCGDSNNFTQTFSVSTAPVITNTVLNQTICSGSPTSLVTFTANPAGTSYSWTATATAGISGFIASGATNTIPIQTIITTNPLAGKVTYVITPSFGGCDGIPVNYEINVNPAPTIITQPKPSSVCLNGVANILKVALSISTVTPTYQWFSNVNNTIGGTAISGATNDSYNPPTTAVGTLFYYCEITLASGGCTSITSDIVSVIVNPKPSITSQPTPTQNLCVGATIPSPLTVAYSGGTGTPSYQWFSNTTNANTGGTLISGATNVDYSPPIYTNANTYYYYVEVKFSSTDCGLVTSNVAEVIVIDKPVITTQPIATQTVCQNAVPVNLNVVVTGGIGNAYDYQWYSATVNNTNSGTAISGATNSTFTPQTANAGTTFYYCIISQTGGVGCSVTSAVAEVIIQISPVIVNQPASSTVCVNGTPTILSFTYSNGSGTPTYQWFSNTSNSNTGGTLISGATNATFNPTALISGTVYYYCVVTFPAISGGCAIINTNPAEVIVNDNPIVANEIDTICSTNTFTIAPTNSGSNIVPIGTTYTWTNPVISPAGTITGASAQSIPQTEISQTLINTTSNVATVTYTVTPTSGICTGGDFKVIITVNPAINPNVVLKNNTCFGVNNATISTSITGGIPFATGAPYLISWTGPNGFTSSATSISNLAPGKYDLNITDAGGCPFSDSYEISEPDDIVVTVDSENNISCFGNNDGSVNLSVIGGTGNYTYTWTKNGNPFASTEDIANLGPGNYQVSVTDVNNCGPKILPFTIIEPPLLVVSLNSQTNVLCFGKATGAIVVDVIGGTLDYDFNWSGPNNFTSNTQNLTDIFAGTYNLIVTDANGCSKNLTVTITQSTEIIISYTTTTIKCYGDNNASITTTLSGGNGPYQFVWSNLSTSLIQTNLSAGDYTITVTDNFGCEKIETINIPEAPVFKSEPIVKNISCFGANDGSINLNLTGGIAPVKLVWSDGSTAGLIRNNLPPGTYTATISDGTPCFIVQTFTIIEPQSLVLDGLVKNALDCTNPNSGSIDLIVAGGTPPYTYSWSNGVTTEDLSNTTSGNYLVTVTDFNGCQKTAQYTITRPPPIEINIATETDFDCDTHTVTQKFVAQVSGGLPPFSLQWSSGTISGANNEIMHTDVNGTVILTVTDSYGCVQTKAIEVNTPVLGYASFDTSSIGFTTYGIYSIEDPIYFQSQVTGDYTAISWNFGDGTFSTELNPVHTYVNADDYVVTQTVTYPFGCVYVYTITLTVEKGYVLVSPTGFTPNNDGINDTYKPVTNVLKNVHLDVYDTWGALIYSETGDDLRGWNGTINGRDAENGNYFSQVSAETFYGVTLKQSTTFTLIK